MTTKASPLSALALTPTCSVEPINPAPLVGAAPRAALAVFQFLPNRQSLTPNRSRTPFAPGRDQRPTEDGQPYLPLGRDQRPRWFVSLLPLSLTLCLRFPSVLSTPHSVLFSLPPGPLVNWPASPASPRLQDRLNHRPNHRFSTLLCHSLSPLPSVQLVLPSVSNPPYARTVDKIPAPLIFLRHETTS